MKKIIYILLISILFASTAFSETKEKEVKLLPLGSIVKLHKGSEDKKLIIIGRTPLATKNGVEGYYDYVGLLHVVGFVEDTFFYFNHEDIEKVFFEGYIDEFENEYQKLYEKEKDSIPYPKLKTD